MPDVVTGKAPRRGHRWGYAGDMADGEASIRSRADDARIDFVLAGIVAVVVIFGTWVELTYSQDPVPPAVGAYAIAIAASAVLVFRRRAPVLVSVATLVLVYGYHLVGYPGEAPGIVFFVAFYSVTAHGRGLRTIATGLALVVAAEFLSVIPPNPVPWYSPAVIAPAASMGGAVLIGAVVRQRRLEAESRTAQAAHDRESALREHMAAERLLIARDLHDVLAHTLSVIAVQAGVALDALDDDPEQARKSIQAVRTAARDVLPGLHETLRALRGESTSSPAPQPGLAQLAGIAEKARASGLNVRLELPPEHAGLSAFLELTAYWIVTEALSNVMAHSDAANVTAAVTVQGPDLHILVADDGRPVSPGTGGFGLAGMQERAQLAGGTVQAGTTAAGGYCVEARLPLGEP
ncbi:two-component sensor histidine kinase [Arthrobacter livingstonensis]|uniref:histidine kinase n=2 Tax=Arthrobacter livingstonensis TaxID=670078 RepID=A0A2V5L302_9MICC|nr:two-component sensor histidine kinase [Arthrobacter livingstonensis]